MAESIRVQPIAFATETRNPNLRVGAAAIAIRDNTKFVDQFDAAKIVDTFRPTRTLVIGQNPAPGTFVPVGTPIDLRLTVKSLLPVEGFKQIDPKVLEKFKDKAVGDVVASYEGTPMAAVLQRPDAGDYDALPAADKAIVNEHIRANYGIDPAADAAAAKSVYGNIKFMNDL